MAREEDGRDDGVPTAGITRSAARVGAATMLSRVFGLARDTCFAILFGTGFIADAFNLAFLIPNFFRRIVGEGNLNPAFVPVFTEIRERRGLEEASRFHARFLGVLLVVLLGMAAAGILLAEPLVRLYARDWGSDPAGLAFATRLLRILFPYLVFAGGAALSMAALNALRHFTVPALAPILLNVCFLGGAALAVPIESLEQRAVVFSIGGLVGGLVSWLVQLPKLTSLGISSRPLWAPRDPDVVRVARLMGPGLLALGVTQLNLFIDTLLALRLEEGSLTALRLGNRVTLLPQGVIGVAIATATLPSLSLHATREDLDALRGGLGHTVRLLLTLLVPAAVGLIVLAGPVVALLFQYGQFTAERSTPMTAAAVAYYALGLPAFGLVKGLAQGFYCVQDTKTPVRVASISMAVNIVLSLVLMGPLGLRGLALATAVASWLQAGLLASGLRGRVGLSLRQAVGRSALCAALASAALAVACVATLALGDALGFGGSLPARLARVAMAVTAGLVALLGVYRALGHEEMREILENLPGVGRFRR